MRRRRVPGEGFSSMLTFAVTGTVGRIRCSVEGLDLSIASLCLLQAKQGEVRWVTCVARDQWLRAQILRRLRVGSIARIEGEIEPRRREIKGVGFYDVVFVARCFEVLEPQHPVTM